MNRSILHLNVVGFFVAVAAALSPRLRGAPVAVATAGRARRVVLDVSAEARAAGLFRGMLLDDARRRCPDVRIADPQPGACERAHAALVAAAAALSPLTEPAGPGHVFVDLTGTKRLLGAPMDVADRLQRSIASDYKLSATIGVAASKMVSKVATRVVKPFGLCGVVDGCEATFLAPLPINLLPGIDAALVRRLMQFNLTTVDDLLGLPAQRLAEAIGPAAADIDRLCRGIDTSPVQALRTPQPSVREEIVMPEQSNDDERLRPALFRLLAAAGMRLRRQGLAAQGLTLALTYADGRRVQRSVRLMPPLCQDLGLFEQAQKLLAAAHARRVRIGSLSVNLTRLTAPYGQLDLFDNTEQEERLTTALDKVRMRFGPETIVYYGRMGGIVR
jgi:DNA polymerase-4